jgi:hypothetical protein
LTSGAFPLTYIRSSPWLWQLFCPVGDDLRFIMYEAYAGNHWDKSSGANANLANFGLAVAVTSDYNSCPVLAYVNKACLFVNTSSIAVPSTEDAIPSPIELVVALHSTSPGTVDVFMLDGSLESLCRGSADDMHKAVRGYAGIPARPARDLWDQELYCSTELILQLTRWRGAQGAGYRNSYSAAPVQLTTANDATTPRTFSRDDAGYVYPVLAPGEVASARNQWSSAAYHKSTAETLIDTYGHDNATNSYYFDVAVLQTREVVTYTQHSAVDPVILLGVYGGWVG